MASTLPTLTWQMTAERSPVDPTAAQDVLDSLALSIGDSTTWRVVTSGAGFLEIGPVVDSPTTDDYVNFRAVIAFGINAAQRQEPHDNTAVDANELWLGISPEGGSVGLIGAGPLTAADPYTTRWSLFWRCSGLIAGGADVDNLFVLTSREVFSFWFNEAAPEDWYGGVCGAMFDPPTDGDGEGTPGRIYGMATTGRTIMSSGFWGSTNEFFNSAAGGSSNVTGCFRPSMPGRWTLLDRQLSLGVASPRQTTEGGTRISVEVPLWQAGVTTIGSSGGPNPTNGIGILRQIRRGEDDSMRVTIQTTGAVDRSYLIGSHDTNKVDVASFDNG